MNKIPERIKTYARLIHNVPVEILMVFDQDFGLKHSYIGDANTVHVDPEEQLTWKDHYTLHNHTLYPISFSIPDIICEAHYNTKGGFVIRKDGMIDFIGRTSTCWNKKIVNDPLGSSIFMMFGAIFGETIFHQVILINQIAYPEEYNYCIEKLMKKYETHFLSEELG